MNELFIERDGGALRKNMGLDFLQLQKYNFDFFEFYKQLHMSKFH